MRIDAHLHFSGDDSDALKMLGELDLKLININVARLEKGGWRRSHGHEYERLSREHPGRYAHVTSFDLPDAADFADPAGYARTVIAELEQDFANGSVGCKIWKNVGMELRDPAGRLVLVDDPIFQPIFQYLEDHDRSLLMHIGEPLACWQPLDRQTPHRSYYHQHPEWHMFGRTDMHSHEALIESRDRVVARHPKLRCIGAHLGSLEYDVDAIADRLKRFPNFAVDTSARMPDLAFQDTGKVRQFFLDYPDRILFGTDIVVRTKTSEMSPADRSEKLRQIRENFAMKFRYYDTDESIDLLGRTFRGLALPDSVKTRFYRENALAWYRM